MSLDFADEDGLCEQLNDQRMSYRWVGVGDVVLMRKEGCGAKMWMAYEGRPTVLFGGRLRGEQGRTGNRVGKGKLLTTGKTHLSWLPVVNEFKLRGKEGRKGADDGWVEYFVFVIVMVSFGKVVCFRGSFVRM